MWKLFKLTLLAAAIESGGSSAAALPARLRTSGVSLCDTAYRIPAPEYNMRATLPSTAEMLRIRPQ